MLFPILFVFFSKFNFIIEKDKLLQPLDSSFSSIELRIFLTPQNSPLVLLYLKIHYFITLDWI